MKFTKTLAACAALALAFPAHAAVVTKSFSFTASNFSFAFGDSSIAPIDPASVVGSVTFDDSVDHTNETAGLVVTTNLPYSVQYAYNSGSDLFVLATLASPFSCSNPSSSYCGFFSNFVASANPLPYFFQQSTPTGGYYIAQTISAGASVPEPATWALLTIGFGAVGAALRRRQAIRIAYA